MNLPLKYNRNEILYFFFKWEKTRNLLASTFVLQKSMLSLDGVVKVT